MKFGVCAILKNENLYLREWVEHYISLGFDKIILYDNNETNGEIPNVVMQDYIDSGLIDIINKRGVNGEKNELGWNLTPQIDAYNECLENYKNKLDWIAFFDIDEFLELEECKTIQMQFDFVNYYDFDVVCVFWKLYADNGNLYYSNEPVQKRFPNSSNINLNMYHVKSICKTNRNLKFTTPHAPNNAKCCSTNKIQLYINDMQCLFSKPFYEHIYLKHYYTKSLTEFLYRKLGWWKTDDTSKEIEKFKSYKNSYITFNGQWSDEHEKLYTKFCNMYLNKEAS